MKGMTVFELRDIVFAAVMAAGILVVGQVLIPLVGHIPIPGIRNMVSAPFTAIFLTIGLARIRKPGALALIYGLCCVVYLMVSVVIPLFVLSSVLVAEGMNYLVFRGYEDRKARMVTAVTFYTVMTPLGALWGAWMLGGQYQRFIASAPFLGLATVIVLLLAFGGTLIGEKIVTELRKAGKMA